MPIEAVPTWYRGIRFASNLEANWAATFDHLGWYWEYEPGAVALAGGAYLPDFRLPHQRVWCEAKGPHDERLGKTRELQEHLDLFNDPAEWCAWMVVVLRPAGPGDVAIWHGALPRQDIVLVRCHACDHYSFLDYAGAWLCRMCQPPRKVPEGKTAPWLFGGHLLRSGEVQMVRAPRGQVGA